jgi:predicted aspartyl protease
VAYGAHRGGMAIRSYLSVFFVVAAVAGGEAGPVTPDLPIGLDRQGSVVVSATVQGSGPFPFLLDTGSSHSAISDDLARELALTPIARAGLQTSTGQTMVPVVEVGAVSVGGITDRLQASVLTKHALQMIGSNVRGVLGRDFLSTHHFTIDYTRRRLRWDDLAEGLDRQGELRMTRVPLVEQDGRFVIQVDQKGRDESLRLVADTGSSELVLFENAGLAQLDLTPVLDRPPMAMSSLTGSQAVRIMRLQRLAIGALTLRDRLAIVVPPVSREYSTVDGLLPLHTFQRVSFRQRDGCLVIEQ